MSIGSNPNNLSNISGVNQNFYQASKVAPQVKVPTILPPGGEETNVELGVTEKGQGFSFSNRFTKLGTSVRKYFRRIGLALFGIDNYESNKGFGKFKTPQSSLNASVSTEPDPVIGSWPAGFGQEFEPLPAQTPRPRQSNNLPARNFNPSAPFAEPQDDISNLLSELNRSQLDQQNLSNWIQ